MIWFFLVQTKLTMDRYLFVTGQMKSPCYWYYYYWILNSIGSLAPNNRIISLPFISHFGCPIEFRCVRCAVWAASIQLSMHPCCANSYRSWHHIGRSVNTKCVATVPQAIQTVESVTISQSFRLSISILPSTAIYYYYYYYLLYASMPRNIRTHKYASTFASV